MGSLLPGFRADYAVVDAPSVDAWLYHGPATPIVETVIGGTVRASAAP